MRTFSFALFAACLMAATALPAGQAAFHNAAFIADGVAVDATGGVYAFQVHWHGSFCGAWSVVKSDLVSGAVLENRGFPGYETIAPANQIPSAPEFFVIQGADTDPVVSFVIRGVQMGNVNFQVGNTLASGTYQDLTFVVKVIAQPISFCN